MKAINVLRRLLPQAWRETVVGDLEEEARAGGHGHRWLAWQLVCAAVRLRSTTIMGAATTDARYSLRTLARTPWFTIGAVLTFAVGFGVNLATFAVVDRILFRHAPYGDPGRLVALQVCLPGTTRCQNSYPGQLWAIGQQHGLHTIDAQASVALSASFDVDASPDEQPLTFVTATPNLLRVLDVHPVLGREPTDAEGAETVRVALLSYETWRSRFGGAANVIGQLVGRAPSLARIIGVLPAGFVPPSPGVLRAAWDGVVFSNLRNIFIPVARLAPGATVAAAQAEINAVTPTLEPIGPRAGGPIFVRVTPIDHALFEMISDSAWIIVAVVALLFLMASANLTTLMLARGQSREREAALRSALGAGTTRIVIVTVAESLVVCVAGAALAWLALGVASGALRHALPPIFARYAAAPLDLRVLAFTLGASAVVAVGTGVWPGLRVARTDVIAALGHAGSQSRSRLFAGRTLVAIEAALGTAVVLVAVVTTTSFSILVDQGTGYHSEGLYLVQARRTAVTPAQALSEYRLMLSAAPGVPGVVGVAGGDSLPTDGTLPMRHFSNDPGQRGGRYELSAGALAVMGARLVAGREFTSAEVQAGAAIAMLNEAGAALVAPGLPAAMVVGRTINLKDESPRLVVGIVPSLRSRYGDSDEAAIFVPLGANPLVYGEFFVRMAPGVRPDLAAMKQHLSDAIGPLPVSMSSVAESVDLSLVEPRFRAVLFVAIALCGLVLAGAGLYALTAFEMSRRTREMGIRLALGATDRRIYWFVTGDVLRPVFVGAAAGLVTTFWAVKFLRLFLYQMNGREPGLYAMATAILVGTAAVTAWLPARRAARTDPAKVLRVS